MKFVRLPVVMLSAALVVMAAVALSGCSKKTAGSSTNTDPTRQTDDAGNQGGNPADKGDGSETPRDEVHDANLNDVFFAYDDHTLSTEARSTLSGNASYLKEMNSIRLTIEGHCDERGTTEYNLALGQRRADAARSYLVDLGIDASRLSTISYGEERPFDTGHEESSWAKNRRAHFRVNNP